jgi:hypothetical protein
MKYVVDMDSDAIIYISGFIKIASGIQIYYTDTQTA